MGVRFGGAGLFTGVMISKREFTKLLLMASAGYASQPIMKAGAQGIVPKYLEGYKKRYLQDPRGANLEWFKEAKMGLFLHYGLYSLMEGYYKGQHSTPAEWVLQRTKMPADEYEKLTERFTAEKFDADFITDMALDAGMKYINITTRHHDSFCLWDSKVSAYNSMNSAARRDLVGELATQCHQKGIALCLYYSHGRDWRHPHAPGYLGERPNHHYDIEPYLDYVTAQMTELLTNYGPIASIWFDGIQTAKVSGREMKVQELYDHIYRLQPQVLISYKHGYTKKEDFQAMERSWDREPKKLTELCDTLQGHSWGYDRADEGKHRTPDEVMHLVKKARELPGNLLLNTGPLPDGSIHPDDIATLKEVGRRLRAGE